MQIKLTLAIILEHDKKRLIRSIQRNLSQRLIPVYYLLLIHSEFTVLIIFHLCVLEMYVHIIEVRLALCSGV